VKLATSGLVPPNEPPKELPAAFMKPSMVSPLGDVYKSVVKKSGAAVALTTFVDSGSGAITTMVAMRAATRDRKPRLFNI
jgi:hypothetical protein